MTRRIKHWLLPIVATLIVVMGMGAGVAAHTGGLPNWGSGGTGDLKAGPLGLNQTPTVANAQLPVAMQIPEASVDANVEVRSMIDGVMQDPTDPYVISWYDFSALVGSDSNAVFAGHVNWYGVQYGVLYSMNSVQAGDEVDVVGENGDIFVYSVEYVDRVNVYDLTPDDLDNIIGPTGYGALTIITCGGDWNGSEYLSRDVLRAKLIGTRNVASASADSSSSDAGNEDDPASSGAFASGATVTVTADAVNMRAEPTTAAGVVVTLAAGDTVTITGESQEADGYVWWPIETADGASGWVAADFLQP